MTNRNLKHLRARSYETVCHGLGPEAPPIYGGKPRYVCSRPKDHRGDHLSILDTGQLNARWSAIDSTVDSVDTDDMTDTKHSKDYQVAIDDMVHRVGVKKAYQWLAALADPETAAEAIMEYVRAERDPRTPEAPAPAPFIPGLGNIFGGPNSPTYR